MENNFPQKAVIIAGGKGTRLYPITKEIPKPLIPVKGKPIINYLVDLFYSSGIKEVAIIIGKNHKEEFEWWQKRHYPEKNIKFVFEEEPLGTFGGIWFLKDWIQNKPFFFTNGDELKKIDLKKMNDFHRQSKTLATIALVQVPDPQNYGVAICEGDLIKEFLEKPQNPPASYISSGLYLFSPQVMNYQQGLKFQMVEKDVFPKLAAEQKLSGFKFNGVWMDCGTWQRYEEALEKWEGLPKESEVK